MSSNLPIIQFNPKLPRLSASEKATLKLLVEAGKLIAPLYLEQEKQAKKGPTSEEVERAGKKDPNILSPYTVVEKINGKFVATPYHEKYAELLAPVAEKLNQAASTTDNKEFEKALRTQAKALLEGIYEEAAATWLKTKPYILDISIGPVEHLDDQLFFGKASYQAWVGTLEVEGTERFNNYKSVTLSARRKALISKERVDNHDKIKAKVIDVALFSGVMARTKFVGVNLPMDVGFVEKYGSEITLFNQANDLRMKEQIIPTFNKIFSKAFREGFAYEDLRRGYLRTVALHELAHSYLYYRHAAENLKELFLAIEELAATVLGLRMAGYLLLKDGITNKQLESMIVTYLCRSFYLKDKGREDKFMLNYGLGGTIFVNYLLECGAIRQNQGLIFPNFMKVFVALHDLENILEDLLSSGVRKDAQILIEKYQD